MRSGSVQTGCHDSARRALLLCVQQVGSQPRAVPVHVVMHCTLEHGPWCQPGCQRKCHVAHECAICVCVRRDMTTVLYVMCFRIMIDKLQRFVHHLVSERRTARRPPESSLDLALSSCTLWGARGCEERQRDSAPAPAAVSSQTVSMCGSDTSGQGGPHADGARARGAV